MKELNKQILKRHLTSWKRWIVYLIKYHPRITKGSEWKKEDDQVYQQIKQLISQSERQVDEEWIEEKAKKLTTLFCRFIEIGIENDRVSDDYIITKAKDFIRSIVQEVQKPKMKEKSITPIGDQAGKDDTFFRSKNMGFGFNAGVSIKKPRITKENDGIHVKIEELKGKLSAKQKMYPLSYPNYRRDLEKLIKEYIYCVCELPDPKLMRTLLWEIFKKFCEAEE